MRHIKHVQRRPTRSASSNDMGKGTSSLRVKAEPRQETNAYGLICKNLWCTKLWGILLLQNRDSYSSEMTIQLTRGVGERDF